MVLFFEKNVSKFDGNKYGQNFFSESILRLKKKLVFVEKNNIATISCRSNSRSTLFLRYKQIHPIISSFLSLIRHTILLIKHKLSSFLILYKLDIRYILLNPN